MELSAEPNCLLPSVRAFRHRSLSVRGLQAAKVFPAMLVGCTIVLKPSEVSDVPSMQVMAERCSDHNR